MTAKLCGHIGRHYAEASDLGKFFNPNDLRRLANYSKAEQPKRGDCKTPLFFGFFFDGTKNNYVESAPSKTQSNIARLYDCYPGVSVPGVLPSSANWSYSFAQYKNFYRTYIPGVSSPFKEVNDTGKGLDETRGGAAGYMGEARILWALIQAINNVHRFFLGVPLVSTQETKSLLLSISLNQVLRREMTKDGFEFFRRKNKDDRKTREEFEKILKRLHAAVSLHWPDKQTHRPKVIEPGIVEKINISIFGFSRGATQARAFTNWLMSLCKLDALLCGKPELMTLGGFEVKFDFLGLFDTVASVGAGNTLGNSFLGKIFDGHGAWADAEDSLRVPDNITCLHLIAAHELRRSFPVDSISVKGKYSPNCTEVVFPGVHSDLGCGYAPGEQGRGVHPDGDDMLTRIPLLVMYRAARLAGVPLKLEFAAETAKKQFNISLDTIAAFNGYIAACETRQGTLTSIMREQANYQMKWRLMRRIGSKLPLERTDSFSRASAFDQNDLHSANLEFEREIKAFGIWLGNKGKKFEPESQDAGFSNDYLSEWEEIAKWWKVPQKLAPEIIRFFDEYVHDSRAWFKLIPGNPDSEKKMIELLEEWNKKRVSAIERNIESNNTAGVGSQNTTKNGYVIKKMTFRSMSDGLTESERKAAKEYAQSKKIPRMITSGREPFEGGRKDYFLSAKGGYLRYRKIYGGWDSVLISSSESDSKKNAEMA